MKTLPTTAGLGIVTVTHIYMLNNQLPEALHKAHAAINLFAAGLIYYGVFM